MVPGLDSLFAEYGLQHETAIGLLGGESLIELWDAGSAYCSCFGIYAAPTMMAEPVVGALVAFGNGWATPDTIWPGWVRADDHGAEGHSYAICPPATVLLTQDNYRQYLEWTDLFAQANDWPYEGKVSVAPGDFSPFPAQS
jgi:hypothetical protein